MFVIIFRNSTDHQKILDEANGKHKMVLDKLNEERALLEVCLAICLFWVIYMVTQETWWTEELVNHTVDYKLSNQRHPNKS